MFRYRRMQAVTRGLRKVIHCMYRMYHLVAVKRRMDNFATQDLTRIQGQGVLNPPAASQIHLASGFSRIF